MAVRAYLAKRLLKQGGTISCRIAGKYLEQHQIVARRLVAGLQAIEQQILRCLVRGMSTRDSAALINISLDELERFRASMMQKLNAHTNADAVRIGLYADLDNYAE